MIISSSKALHKLLGSPLRLKLFFLKSLPMAFLAGLRVVSYDSNKAIVSLPFKYLTKNPFHSIYFACMAMAAEFSTAILCLQEISKHDVDVSLLVVGLEAEFVKKANQQVNFSCMDEAQLKNAIHACITSDEPQKISLDTIGTDPQGNTIAEFKITWSFKTRN